MSTKKIVKAHNPSQPSNVQRQTKPYISLVELGIPNDLNIFRQSVIHTSDGIFDTIAETTLDDARREFFDIQLRGSAILNTKEEFHKIVKENNLKTKTDLRNFPGRNLRKMAMKYGIWDDFPNGKKGNLSNEAFIEMKNEALKYNSRNEFKNNSRRLYNKARYYNLIDDICKHMISYKESWMIGRGFIKK